MTRCTERNAEAHHHLERLVERSKRSSGIQLPVSFARDPGGNPPLARLLKGGRNGEVRLKLYLTMILLAAQEEDGKREIRRIAARAWATALALPDPHHTGARAIADAIGWLDKHKFIRITRRPGGPPDVQLRSATGRGKRFVRPSGIYIRVPVGLWNGKWIWVLSGKALALLVILLDLQGGKKEPQWISGEDRHRYGLSADTWRLATRELCELGLLKVTQVRESPEFEMVRVRNAYRVDTERLDLLAPGCERD